jgi:hypothetical protein
MDEREKLEKMDLLCSRFRLSYDEARSALAACGWDAVEAAVRLDLVRKQRKGFMEQVKVTGSDLIDTLKRLLHQGDITRIIVKDPAGKELINLPVNGVLAVTALIPLLTAVGAVVAVTSNYTIEVERRAE